MFKNSPHCKSDTAKHSFGYDQILGLSSPPRKRYLHVNYGVFTHVAQAASKWCLLFGARWIMKPWFRCLGNSISSKIQWVFLFLWSQKRWAWLIHILSTSKADVFSRLDLLGRRSFSTFPQVAQPAQIYDSLQLGHRCGAGRKRDPRLVQRGLVSLANGILLVTSPQNNVSTHCRRRDSQRNVFFWWDGMDVFLLRIWRDGWFLDKQICQTISVNDSVHIQVVVTRYDWVLKQWGFKGKPPGTLLLRRIRTHSFRKTFHPQFWWSRWLVGHWAEKWSTRKSCRCSRGSYLLGPFAVFRFVVPVKSQKS